MVEFDESTRAGKVKASGIEGSLGGLGCERHGLGHSIHVSDQAGLAGIVDGKAPLAGMDLCCRICCQRTGQGECSRALNWAAGRRQEKIGSASAWAQLLIFFGRRIFCQRTGWGRRGECSGALSWAAGRWPEKIGSASAWARFLIFFRQRGHRQAWLVGLE
jgi:hypothetical protein